MMSTHKRTGAGSGQKRQENGAVRLVKRVGRSTKSANLDWHSALYDLAQTGCILS